MILCHYCLDCMTFVVHFIMFSCFTYFHQSLILHSPQNKREQITSKLHNHRTETNPRLHVSLSLGTVGLAAVFCKVSTSLVIVPYFKVCLNQKD